MYLYICNLLYFVIIVFIVTTYCRTITISISRGGFGHVYAGVREKDHKLVAIKVLNLAKVLTEEYCDTD